MKEPITKVYRVRNRNTGKFASRNEGNSVWLMKHYAAHRASRLKHPEHWEVVTYQLQEEQQEVV